MVAGQVSKAAVEKNETFPFVTVDLFEVIGGQARAMSGILEVVWSPSVEVEEFDVWNTYATENIGWYNDSIALFLAEPGHNLTEEWFNHSSSDYSIKSPFPFVPTSEGPWAPRWQASPPVRSTYEINFDSYGYGANTSNNAIETFRRAVMSEVLQLGPPDAFAPPICAIGHPVFDSLLNLDTAKIAGKVYSIFFWDSNMVNLLPEGASNITAVLKNSCNQSFTYSLQGTSVSSFNMDCGLHWMKNRTDAPFAFRSHM
jgi:hypothetical protein